MSLEPVILYFLFVMESEVSEQWFVDGAAEWVRSNDHSNLVLRAGVKALGGNVSGNLSS